MPDEVPSSHTQIPESLRVQLEQFRRRLWKTKIAEAAFAGLFGLLLSYLLVFALDRVWPTPGWVRLAILVAGSSLMAVFAPLWMHRWVWRHRRENQLARLIARKHPGMGDRLLGVIELQDDEATGDSFSPQLRAAAMNAVAAEAGRRQLDDSLPTSRHRRWLAAAAAALALAVASLALVPEAGFNSLKRWLLPLSATERYTFTLLDGVPLELPVPQGEAFTLELALSERSEWRPATARARYGRQDPVTAELEDGRYRFDFPGQQEPGILRVDAGDARHAIRIVPSLRPNIERSLAEIRYPDYLQLEDSDLRLAAGTVSAVSGSRLRLTVQSSRPLRAATYGPVSPLRPAASGRNSGAETPGESAADQPPSEDSPAPAAEAPEPVPMAVRENRATSDWIEVGGQSLRVPVRWQDDIGLSGSEGFALTIDALPDEAPSCYLEGIPAQQAILAEETVEFDVTATDDFGLRETGLVWEGEPTRAGHASAATGELRLERGAPDLARSTVAAAFSPRALEIGPQKLTLRAYAEDYLPDRGRVYSQPVIVYILSPEEHAEMLKNQFDRAIGELEDLAREERNLFEENQRLERLDGAELRDEEAAERLGRQEQAEAEQAGKMEELAERMEELLQDSARNESIDEDTMRKMVESMQSMREMAEQDMPEIESRLKEAGEARNTEEKSEREMAEAVDEQEELLEKMRETIEKANEANQQFEASTFVSRLKKAADDEEAVVAAAMEGSEHFGLRPEQLDPAELGRLDDIARRQSETSSDVSWIQEDLGHFFTRTDKEVFGEIMRLMAESDIGIGLQDVRLKIGRNHGFEAASEADAWAAKLREWASMLEDSGEAGGGGGGGGGGSDPDEDFEFMLRVMRLVQQEQDIRARTRALETLRRSLETDREP